MYAIRSYYATEHTIDKEGAPHGAGDGGEDTNHARDLPLHRSVRTADGLGELGDTAKTGAQSGGENNATAAASHHGATGKGDVAAFPERSVLTGA